MANWRCILLCASCKSRASSATARESARQLFHVPHVIDESRFHRWRHSQRLMCPAEVVIRESRVQAVSNGRKRESWLWSFTQSLSKLLNELRRPLLLLLSCCPASFHHFGKSLLHRGTHFTARGFLPSRSRRGLLWCSTTLLLGPASALCRRYLGPSCSRHVPFLGRRSCLC